MAQKRSTRVKVGREKTTGRFVLVTQAKVRKRGELMQGIRRKTFGDKR